MFYTLISAAVILFLAHVILLIASFTGPKFATSRYFYSHLTLWLTGLTVFVLALLYSGAHLSSFLDYFDTQIKKAMILVFTFALSLVAHCIVKLLVLPAIARNKSGNLQA